MGIVRMGIPDDFVLALKNHTSVETFIEAGTFHGGTAIWAASHFNQVFTIEFSESIYQQTKPKLATYPNIYPFYGDSRTVLAEIMPQLTAPALFWLDSHWSGGDTYGATDECPLIEELRIICQSNHAHMILIDDARFFLAPPPLPHALEQWPTMAEIIAEIQSSQYRYYIVVLDDVIIAVPWAQHAFVAAYSQMITTQSWKMYGKRRRKAVMLPRFDLIKRFIHPKKIFRTLQQRLFRSASPLAVEQAEQTFYIQYLKPGMVVFDVGAHVGELTLLFSRFVGSTGSVHAFEATTATYQRLQTLLKAAERANVVTHHLALADRETTLNLHVYEQKHSGWNSLAQRPLQNYGIDVQPTHTEQVTATTVDAYCQAHQIQQIDLLKIDVEGAEYQVLLGARRMLEERKIACVVFEFGQTTFDMGNHPAQIQKLLQGCGYRLQNVVARDSLFPGGRSVQTARFSVMVARPR